MGNTLYIDQTHVNMTARVSDVDIQSLRDPYTPTKVGRIQFAIFNAAGTVIAGGVMKPSTNPAVPIAATYTWGFDRTVAVSDGLYVFKATAYSYRGFQGNTAQVVAQWELGAPAGVTGVAAKPGNGQVLVSWNTSLAGDLDYYELYRGTSPGTATLYKTGVADTSFVDTGLTNGQPYYYQVRSVDKLGLASGLSAEVSATPVASADGTPPTAPESLAAAKSGPNTPTIVLVWGEAKDQAPNPQTGIAAYLIERSKTSTGPWAQLESNWPAGNLTYPDATAGFSSTWYYRVRAIDGGGNIGPFSGVASATTDAPRVQKLTVRNTSTAKDYYCVVQQLSPPNAYYSTAGVPASAWNGLAYKVLKKGGEVKWNNLPAGLYSVYFSESASGPWSVSKTGDLTPGDAIVQVP
jgi:predicted phage tail protein